ncbi:DUF305 domain-containing protein [Actinokineospora sp. UTMC 2448]|uniref:DUF305 domain-containing protein n=1 Tax=Actinokineospora sp. UTMC 2448 TaxID=2268449 RepID=UPI0021642C52|nr:DUF305 domain-containing protein [Actinokineospora sp. UTMC 2448]UVS78891.1 putative outer membrane protein [Actinokineospora sp. UTMC 2448]
MRRCALFALVLALTGCAGPLPAEFAPSSPAAGHGHQPVQAPPPSPAVGDYNLADVMYLQMAIANHEQGIELVALAEKRAVRPEVAQLAAAIGATQRTEVGQMEAWLTGWGQPTEVDTNPDAHAHHGGMPITDPESLAALAAAPDGEFEAQFVSVLTGHQHNAVEMARRELTDGVSPDVKKFADKVVQSRTGQISALLNLGSA